MQIYSINQIPNYGLMNQQKKQNNTQNLNVSNPMADSNEINGNYNKATLNFRGNKLLESFPSLLDQWVKELDIDNRTIKSCKAYWNGAVKEDSSLCKFIKQCSFLIGNTSFIMQGHNDAIWKYKPYVKQEVILLNEKSIPKGCYEINYTLNGKIIKEDGYLF